MLPSLLKLALLLPAAAAVAAAAAAASSPPASWIPRIQGANMLYTNDEAAVAANNMPMIGNGFVATQIMSPDMFLANIYNGFGTISPSHRARLSSTLAYAAPGTTCDAALDVEAATYYRRSTVDPPPPGAACTNASTSSCTNAGARIWVEQRWYAHRTLPSVLVMEVEVLTADAVARDYGSPAAHGLRAHGRAPGADAQPYARLALVNNPGNASTDILFQPLRLPVGSAYTIINGSTVLPETNTSGLQTVAVLDNSVSLLTPTLYVSGPGITYTFLTVLRTSVETPVADLPAAVEADFAQAAAFAANGTLHSVHVAEWAHTIWANGFETDRFDVARVTNSSLYALVSSIRADRVDGICPSGLTAGYNGHKFWDQETWMWPGVAALHPDLGAALLMYRYQRIPGAAAKAASYSPPYFGLDFPWESALTGQETCPSWAGTGLREIHINGDIAVAVWQFWRSMADNGNKWLSSIGYPLLAGIADYWISRMLHDTPGASIPGYNASTPTLPGSGNMPLHIRDVIPPDEYHDHVNDSIYTNVGAYYTLTYAVEAAKLLGEPASHYAGWLNASQRIVLLYNASVPGLEGGMHPEYAGYYNATIKQADVILLGYPLNTPLANNTPQTRLNDLEWYSRVSDPNGPAMTWGMFAAGYATLGELDMAAAFFNRSFANAQAPFDVWTETPTGGCANFLTGAGGFLQVPLLAYPGIFLNDTAMTLKPALFEGASRVVIRGYAYRGSRLRIEYDAASVTLQVVTADASMPPIVSATRHTYAPLCACDTTHTTGSLLPATPLAARSQRGQVVVDGYRVAAPALVVVDASGRVFPLGTAPVSLPVGQQLVITTAA